MVKCKFGRDIALLMVIAITALICGLPMYASANDLSQNDEPAVSKLTADVETDIYQVVMPTDTDGIFDFILDPQRLINKTNGAMYNGKSFEKNCTVFFRRSDGKAKVDYSSESDFVTFTNKSTMPVEVSLEVKVDLSSLEGIKMTEDRSFKKDKSASLYLAVVDGEKEVPVGKDGVVLRKTIETAPDGTYEYAYNSDTEKYEYRLKKDIKDSEFGIYSFQLTGAVNEKGDWRAFTKVAPEILITWKITPKENRVLRKDAVFDGKALENIPDGLEQESEQQEQGTEAQSQPQPVRELDNAGTEQEKQADILSEDGNQAATDNDGAVEGASDCDEIAEGEKADMDTNGLIGEK